MISQAIRTERQGYSPLRDVDFRDVNDLARHLVNLLGVDSARRMCLEYHWYGILPAIDAIREALATEE
ncbi:MAG TPA: hypothetical protein VKA19_06050 [Alphaproteobacteria bacterium]|nr:hypothetical protein [Alphaproteobacteria bacterium]